MEIMEKIKERSRLITTLFCVFAAMVALSYKLMKQRESGVENDYHNAHLFFEKWKGGEEEGLDDLSKLFKNRPALRTAFRGRIAQHLLNLKKVKQAKEYRVSSDRKTPYEKYAATSFLVAEGDFILALTQAKELQNEMDASATEQQWLRAFNLLRIAGLEREVGTKKGELEALTALDALDGTILASLQEVFSVNEVTLNDYLKHRKATLAGYIPEA